MDNFVTVRLSGPLKKKLEDLQDDVRRATGKKPALSALIESALKAQANYSPVSGKSPGSISDENSQSSYTGEFSGWHRILEAILVSGDREAISAVQQNLRVFYRGIGDPDEILRRGKGTRKPEKAKTLEAGTPKPAGIKKPHRQPGTDLLAKT